MSIMQDYNHKRVDEALGLLVSIKNVVSQEITSFMSHLRKIGPPLITFPINTQRGHPMNLLLALLRNTINCLSG